MGGPEFFGVVKGGTSFYSVDQRGGPEFFEGHRGGTRIFSQDGDLIDIKIIIILFNEGGPDFFCMGGAKFFCACRGGVPKFLVHAKGGQEKIGDLRSQTDGPTPCKK